MTKLRRSQTALASRLFEAPGIAHLQTLVVREGRNLYTVPGTAAFFCSGSRQHTPDSHGNCACWAVLWDAICRAAHQLTCFRHNVQNSIVSLFKSFSITFTYQLSFCILTENSTYKTALSIFIFLALNWDLEFNVTVNVRVYLLVICSYAHFFAC